MYHWIEDRKFLGKMRTLCSGTVNELVQSINNDKKLKVKAYLVGSGAKNLETQNENLPIDLDYNLDILQSIAYDINDGRAIKEYVRKVFNRVLENHDWGNCEDSKSALQTKKRHFPVGNSTEFSIDLAIVKSENDGHWSRLILEKTGSTKDDRYYWNQAPDSKDFADKADRIKSIGKWESVRKTYLSKKNMYLQRSYRGEKQPSFIIFIEAVNEEYSKLFGQESKQAKPTNKPDVQKKNQPTPPVPKKNQLAVSEKILFNNEIQQRLAKTKQYKNEVISEVASLCGPNFNSTKSKKAIHNELLRKFGQKQGDAIYQRIVSMLK